MASWLETRAPRRFQDLAMAEEIRNNFEKAAVSSTFPHLLLAGPAGVGKTAVTKLLARQVLGSGWKSTTHILQAKDLKKSAGAMKTFETFLRPGGGGKGGTLAGTSSLDAFDRNLSTNIDSGPAPAGTENDILLSGRPRAPVARIIIIEDADHLGPIRQAYLRRMMESESHTSRFIFTARTPSRVMDALRSRCQLFRIPSTTKFELERVLSEIALAEGAELAEGLLGDIIHTADGNLRKGIFLLEMLIRSRRYDNRSSLHSIIAATTSAPVQQMFELSLRGRVHEWRWETLGGGRNKKVLKGAMGHLDELMGEHAMAAEDILDQIHHLLTRGRLLLPEGALTELLDSLARCDSCLPRSMHPRIQIEKMLHEVSDIGRRWALAIH